LSLLGDLSELTSLSLEDTEIDDEGLAEIAAHQPDLRTLFLSSTKVTSVGLRYLSGMNSLSRLDLAECDIRDSGLTHLETLENLRAVGLDSTRVSESGMHNLSEALFHNAVIQGPHFSLLGGKRFEVVR
jgi:Leucine-rich repeat (LRR) protein